MKISYAVAPFDGVISRKNVSIGQTVDVTTPLFDIAGKKLKEIRIVNHIQQINLSALPSGIYTAVLYKESSVIAVEKLLIQH